MVYPKTDRLFFTGVVYTMTFSLFDICRIPLMQCVFSSLRMIVFASHSDSRMSTILISSYSQILARLSIVGVVLFCSSMLRYPTDNPVYSERLLIVIIFFFLFSLILSPRWRISNIFPPHFCKVILNMSLMIADFFQICNIKMKSIRMYNKFINPKIITGHSIFTYYPLSISHEIMSLFFCYFSKFGLCIRSFFDISSIIFCI